MVPAVGRFFILGAMAVTEVFAGIAVRDRDAAIEFYERLLGAPPTMLPNDGEAAWQLTGGGWLYVLRDVDRAGRAVVTLLVDDLDERLAAAAARGIELGSVETVAGSVRTTWITDPDGNRVQIGQPG
jgi:catechol 2,3-dioxygenase-like lactoylglutathione lyase family enzyme